MRQPSRTDGVDLAVLFDDLVRVETQLWNAVDNRLRSTEGGVPLTWYEPLRVVASTPSCRVVDIADALLVTMGGASKLVGRIEAAHLCERRPHPADRRSAHITLTPAGTQLLHRLTAVLHDELELRLRRALGVDGVAALSSALRDLRASPVPSS